MAAVSVRDRTSACTKSDHDCIVGLVPSESTTGQQRRLGSITKTGSAHARRLLIKAAWHYRARPNLGKALIERQADQPQAAIAVA
ncbi:MAG TPA: transposase [Solirubrobacteraceae bacterium]